MRSIFFTFVATTLFWFGFYKLYTKNSGSEAPVTTKLEQPQAKITEQLIGKWVPIEIAKHPVEFTKYGVMIHYSSGLFGTLIEQQSPYRIEGDMVSIQQRDEHEMDETIHFRVAFSSDEQYRYLEIFGVTQIGGKYRQALEKPTPAPQKPAVNPTKTATQSKPKSTPTRQSEAAPTQTTAPEAKSTLSTLTDQVKERVQQAKQSITPPAEPINRDLFGKWKPVEGAKWPLEFTPYGTVIQYPYGVASRYNYSVAGEAMKIRYDQAKFAVVEESGTVYLELYNTTDFSGRYEKVSQPPTIVKDLLPREEYATLIVGKWSPVIGQQWKIEFTKFGTVIQYPHDVEVRYEYKLDGDQAKIRYDEARIAISEDAQNYYLEIYNATDFSGCYKRLK